MLQKRLKEFAEIDKRVDVVNWSFPIKRTHREFIVCLLYTSIASGEMNVEVGSLDITLYGADHNLIAKYPVLNDTDIRFSIDNKIVVLVDDILYTGKTIHTAIDALLDIGSPSEVQLACFVDRGRRTFPISADYVGVRVPSSGLERVVLHVEEVDGESCVMIEKRDSSAAFKI